MFSSGRFKDTYMPLKSKKLSCRYKIGVMEMFTVCQVEAALPFPASVSLPGIPTSLTLASSPALNVDL